MEKESNSILGKVAGILIGITGIYLGIKLISDPKFSFSITVGNSIKE